MDVISRRRFVTTTAGLAGVLATGIPPARGQQRQVSYLCWNNFAPASDKKLAEIGQRFTKDTGIKIRIDHIAAAQQAAKYASEVQTQAGHDVVEMRMHFPWLYEPQLVDVSDLVPELEKKYGAVLPSARETAMVKGVWRAVPQYHTFFVAAYREDLFKQASLKVPDTWEDLYTVGKELKKMGHPVGHSHQPELRLDLHGRSAAVDPRRQGSGEGRQDRRHQLAADGGGRRVVQEDVPGLHGTRGPLLVGFEQ